MVCIAKAIERKLNTFEIKFLHKNVSYDRFFAKVTEKMNFLSGGMFGHLKDKFSFQLPTWIFLETSDN